MINLNKTQKKCIQYGFLILLICITAYLVSKTLDIKLIPKIIKLVDKKFIFIGFLLITFYIIFEAITIDILINSIEKIEKKFLSTKIAMMGFYYNLVTPFASGSQPMQIYTLNKYGISLSKSSAIVTNKTVLFQSIVTIYCGVVIFLNMELLKRELHSILLLMSMGMIMNIVSLLGCILLALSPNTIKFIVKKIFNLLSKLNIFKTLNEKLNIINKFIDEYSYSINLFIKNKKALFISILLTIVQLTVFFSVSYCIYRAFNLNKLTYIYILSLQVFLYIYQFRLFQHLEMLELMK